MATQELNENIPTLTQIIQPGDMSMENHFDASCFDKNDTELETGKNNATPENILVAEDDSKQDIEQMLLDNMFFDHTPESEENGSSDKINNEPEDTAETGEPPVELSSTATNNDKEIAAIELKDTIDSLISAAVKTVLPAFEKQLTVDLSQQIYQKLLIELSTDNQKNSE